MRRAGSHRDRDALAHWVWTVPILVIFAGLGIQQIDLFPPVHDEFYSMNNSGWLVHGPYSPSDVLASLQKNSPNHTPGYFLLLNLWGSLTGYELAVGRVLSVLCGILSLSMAYRLARDFVAPVAGLFAVILVASNAFYNFYIPHLRMYPLLVFASGVVLWLYLRIMYRFESPRRSDYIALLIAVFVMINLHAYSAFFLAALGIYHLLALSRDQRWWRVCIAVCAAVMLFSPWAIVLLSGGIERSRVVFDKSPIGSHNAISAWLYVTTNGQPLLITLSVGGLVLAVQKLQIRLGQYLVLVLPFWMILGLAADNSSFVTFIMRHHLSGWLLWLLVLVTGLYALYVYRKWFGLVLLLWVFSGILLQRNANWWPYLGLEANSHNASPWQVISRLVAEAESKPQIIGYRAKTTVLDHPSFIDYSQREHFFDDKGIDLLTVNDPHEFGLYMRHDALILPEVWIVLQTSIASPYETIELQTTMKNLDYKLCGRAEVGVDTVIQKHSWNVLDCGVLELQSGSRSELVDYRYFGSRMDTEDSKLYFVDAWSAQAEVELDNYLMSYQLISPDWRNVAQLDLPLVHEGVARRFSIDVAGVPAGSYRLMTILYDIGTGERVTWIDNDGELPYMLTLAEIEIRDED